MPRYACFGRVALHSIRAASESVRVVQASPRVPLRTPGQQSVLLRLLEPSLRKPELTPKSPRESFGSA